MFRLATNPSVLDLAAFALAVAVAGAAPAAEFAVLIYEPAEEHALRAASGPATDAYWADYGAWAGAMAKAGVVRGGAPVAAEGAAMGPVPAGGLVLGGWMLLDVADLDAAKAWAARSPALARGGAVDVRAVDANPTMPAPSAQ